MDKFTLFTNLQYVSVDVGGSQLVRTNCAALLLEDTHDSLFNRDDSTKRRYSVRGFGPSASWPVFDLLLSGIEIESCDPAQSASGTLKGEVFRPLSSGSILKLKNGPSFQLHTSDQSSEVRRDDICGEPDEHPILRVWEILEMRAAQYETAPNKPHLIYVHNPNCRY